jgi:hypothetical protein
MTPDRIELTSEMVVALYDIWRQLSPKGIGPIQYYQSMEWDLSYNAVSRLYSIPRHQLTFFLLTL